MKDKLLKSILKNWKYLLLFFLISIPVFARLGSFPIQIWDESRLAINAYEMYYDENYIVTHFEGKPDLWNTKPPLMIWFQVISMKIFGINEFAVRFPSALAAILTCLILLLFSIRYLKNFWFGFCCILVLLTAEGYVSPHSIRTGDYDALLVFFTTLSLFSFFLFTETFKNRYIYLFFISLALAVLTKSITGLMFIPALLIYISIRKLWFPILKNKHVYFSFLGFLVMTVGYYAIREIITPGYFAMVCSNELGGRFLETLETHKHPFDFYFNNLLDTKFTHWIWFSVSGILIGVFLRNVKMRRIALYSFVLALSFLLVISFSETKLRWYDLPVYPFLAILTAISIIYIFDLLKNSQYIAKYLTFNIIPFLFLFLLFTNPYMEMTNQILKDSRKELDMDYYGITYYLRDILHEKIPCEKKCYIVHESYIAHNQFYINLLNDNGFHFSRKDWKDLNPHDIVFVFEKEIVEAIEENYDYDILDEYYTFRKYLIRAK